MRKWRYRPEGNRTPVSHPTIGHLDHDGVYEHPDCAGNPDFQEVHDKKLVGSDADEATPTPEIVAPVVAPAPAINSPGEPPADAGQPGRS